MFFKVSSQQCPNCGKPIEWLWTSPNVKKKSLTSDTVRCGYCMRCSTHPTYTGVRKSKVNCRICNYKWNMMRNINPQKN